MFKQFADAVNKRFLEISKDQKLFTVGISKQILWESYQKSFPEGTNEIFRERRHHECNTCYNFIKRLGPVVSILDGKIQTIWDIEGLEYPYDQVAKAMNKLIIGGAISSIFLTDEKVAGKEYNIEANEAGDIKWEHFYADIDQAFISQNIATDRGQVETTVAMFNRALTEFSISDLETVEDLCDSIYRGEEFKPTVSKFLKAKKDYEASDSKTIFLWTSYNKYPARIRNTAIGTLIIDIAKGTELEDAVKAYEAVVAPSNYKRTSAVVTPRMREDAIKKIDELNLRDSLPRRHARLEDISVNNVLFANSDASTFMKDSLEDLIPVAKTKKNKTSGSREVTIDNFLDKVLPNSRNIEALVENKHISNFISLVAPQNPEAPNMLKWDNNFSWSYNGEVTDSMKEKVKSAGGKVDGVLRFSIQWNEEGKEPNNDLDAHCQCPQGHISYSNKMGRLDVDITTPGKKIAVENITWPTMKDLKNGTYRFYVHNFSGTNKQGFRAEIEFNGEIHEYDYKNGVRSSVTVATVIVKDGEFTIQHSMESGSSTRKEWDISTLEYQPVSTIMLSPNHWDEQKIGNKHFFFMLEGAKNPDSVRGFYNEFLSEDLRPHRKVFETLSSTMKCEPDEHQLSGLGFSSSQTNTLHVKVDNIPYTIKFNQKD